MVTDRVAAERRAERRAERHEQEELELALAISASLAEQEQLEQRDRLAAAARAAIQPPVVPSVGPPTNMPSAPPAHSSAPPDETVCIICMDEPRNATLVHGDTGHVCCCLKCAQDLKAKGLACPMCRKPIDVVIRQFT
jgi:E3 ubiquitin-protein ligase Mdm2